MLKIQNLKIKIFADGADSKQIYELDKKDYIKGFTTNPTLMRKAGITDYKKFALAILSQIRQKPISFEVFSNEIDAMEKQAMEIYNKIITDFPNSIYAQKARKKYRKLRGDKDL